MTHIITATAAAIRRRASRTRKATALTFAAVALLVGGASLAATASATTTASASGSSLYGCPYGAVCIYPQNAGLNGGHPEPGGVYYRYGSHDLHNQFGYHTIVNNQYGGAGYKLCTGYHGTGSCTRTVSTVGYDTYNLTPYNSIVLTKPVFCPPTHCPPV